MSTENDTYDLKICKLNLSCQVNGIIRYKHTASLRPTLPRSSLPAVSYRRIGHLPRFHALVPRLTRAARQYFVLFRQVCVVSIILCCVSTILCCVSIILVCVSQILICVSKILCCVSQILTCVSQILTCVSKLLYCVSRIVCCVCRYGPP